MSRYVDADLAIKSIENDCIEAVYYTKQDAIECIKSQPTADVVEVRHGYWIERIVKPDWLEDDVEVYYDCSECGMSHWSSTSPYCPECGAKMDGERKLEDE